MIYLNEGEETSYTRVIGEIIGGIDELSELILTLIRYLKRKKKQQFSLLF